LPDWLVPIDQQPISLGCLVIVDGKIHFFGQQLPPQFESIPQIRLQGVAIIPGLVNAHCHLEFSDLTRPIPATGTFADWIRAVLERRQSQPTSVESFEEDRKEALKSGLLESYGSGVRWIVDMTTQPWQPDWLSEMVRGISSVHIAVPLIVQPCMELIDVRPDRHRSTVGFWNEQKDAHKLEGCQSIGAVGLAPHASYTASQSLTDWSVQQSRKYQRLLSMHLAESCEEMQWLECQQGPFAGLLSSLVDAGYLEGLGTVSTRVPSLVQAHRALIAHGNYLSEADLAVLSDNDRTMAIVHCPRTHAHFAHPHPGTSSYPLSARMKQGVTHFLGTDSRASNPNLNLWQEAQWVRAKHLGIDAIDILKMITTAPSDLIGIPDGYGRFQVGAIAALTAIQLPLNRDGTSVFDQLLEPDTRSVPLEYLIELS
jgi:aminodeoxyfutalosine deaminase